MSYGTQYRAEFSNELNQNVLILFAQKDVAPLSDPIPFEISEDGLEMNDDSDDGTIIAREVVITINADDQTAITWETFLTGGYDEWWVIIYVDYNAVFEGFLTPEEGSAAFLDKPYDVTLRATNGLKLLQNIPLTKQDGLTYKGKFTLIDYISSALSKTLLNNISSSTGIPIRIYSNVFEASMTNRYLDITKDFYQQTKLDHRTFQKDPTTFVSCYDTLSIILKRHSRLFYWNARWVIEWIGEHQYAPGGRYYTEYNADGTVIQGVEDLENYATVGKTALIYPINEDQLVSSNFAINLARTDFKFKVWKEIPLNNKFDRGTFIDEGPMADIYDQDGDGNITETIGTYKRHTIDDWTYGLMTSTSNFVNLPALTPASAVPSRRSIYTIYGTETIRELILPPVSGGSTPSFYMLQADGIPVKAYSRLKITMSLRLDSPYNPSTGSIPFFRGYIQSSSLTDRHWLRYSDDEEKDKAEWIKDSLAGSGYAVNSRLMILSDTTKFYSLTVETQTIPVDGTFYFSFITGPTGRTIYITGFDLEYIPYIAGGYIQVEGDYVQHSQDANNQDNDIEEIMISDSQIQVVEGAMLNAAGLPTNPTWYRGNIVERQHFKGLVNLVRFNMAWRRFWDITGSFTSLDFEPENDQLNKQPIGYHKNYRFIDLGLVREFILRPPLRMNLCTGDINAEFQEVLQPTNTTEVSVEYSDVMAAIVLAINQTTNSEWDSAGLAPGIGTPYFPPQAAVFTPFTTVLAVVTNPGGVVTVSASPGTASNTPVLFKDSETVVDGKRITVITLGPDIEIGNIFTVSVFGHDVVYTVENKIVPVDGGQEGAFKFDYSFGNG
ncbi:hypothetical protein [Flavitalea sp.]|nr:hypothetical protein [Flavitalea sp.]